MHIFFFLHFTDNLTIFDKHFYSVEYFFLLIDDVAIAEKSNIFTF